jgi:hypothetical protein
MDQAQLIKKMHRHGYTNVSNLRQSGSDWTGSATDTAGEMVVFQADPTGTIVVQIQ